MVRHRNVGEARAVKCRHQEVARAADTIAREHAARAVGAMAAGARPTSSMRVRIAKARNRAAPVGLGPVGALLLLRDGPAACTQARTTFT